MFLCHATWVRRGEASVTPSCFSLDCFEAFSAFFGRVQLWIQRVLEVYIKHNLFPAVVYQSKYFEENMQSDCRKETLSNCFLSCLKYYSDSSGGVGLHMALVHQLLRSLSGVMSN